MSGFLVQNQDKLNGYFLGGGMNRLHAARFLIMIGGMVVATVGNLSWAASCTPLLDHRMTTLQGNPQDFCQYEGKVVLAVNTASYCGYTQQYASLEALYQKYKSRGLVVLGFPSNDFGKQEPGSNAEKSRGRGRRKPLLCATCKGDRKNAAMELPQVSCFP